MCAVTGGEEWLQAAAVTQRMAVQATLKLKQMLEDVRGGKAEGSNCSHAPYPVTAAAALQSAAGVVAAK